MWLAERVGAQTDTAPDIRIGRVTIGGKKCAVMLDGEIRNVEVASPKGYSWTPEKGDEVLVLKSEGEWFIIAATAGTGVGKNGVELCGEVNVNGTLKINGIDIMSLINKS